MMVLNLVATTLSNSLRSLKHLNCGFPAGVCITQNHTIVVMSIFRPEDALLSYVQQLHVRSARSACPKKVLSLSSFLLPVLGMIELNPYFLI